MSIEELESKIKNYLDSIVAKDEPAKLEKDDVATRDAIIDARFDNKDVFLSHLGIRDHKSNRTELFHLIDITMEKPTLQYASRKSDGTGENYVRITKYKERETGNIKYYVLVTNSESNRAITHYISREYYLIKNIRNNIDNIKEAPDIYAFHGTITGSRQDSTANKSVGHKPNEDVSNKKQNNQDLDTKFTHFSIKDIPNSKKYKSIDTTKLPLLDRESYKNYIDIIIGDNNDLKRQISPVVYIGNIDENFARLLNLKSNKVFLVRNSLRKMEISNNPGAYDEILNLPNDLKNINKAYIDLREGNLVLGIKDINNSNRINLLFIDKKDNGIYINLYRNVNDNFSFKERYREITE